MVHRSLNFSHPGHAEIGMCSGKWLGNGKLLNIEISCLKLKRRTTSVTFGRIELVVALIVGLCGLFIIEKVGLNDSVCRLIDFLKTKLKW